MAWPSGPAFSTHSAVIFSPTLSSSACSASGAGWTFILLALSWSMYHAVFSSETFQPRSSAVAAALSRASRAGWSSASKAFFDTNTMFFGSQAWMS